MEPEIWKSVPGFEGYYEVSSKGDVRSLDRPHHPGQRLRGQTDKHGYRFVTLSVNRASKRVSVHRLVAQAFLPNPEGHPMVLHWDDDPSNNRVENLRWGARSDNGNDSVRNGNHPRSRNTHCVNGHEFTDDNTYVRNNGARRCRICTLDQNRRSRDNK